MSTRPETTTGSVLLTYLVLVAGGAGVGALLARVAGDGSTGALTAGAVTLPIALGIGVGAWGGLAKAWIVAKLWGALRRPEIAQDPKAAIAAQFAELRDGGPLPGAWVFLPVSLGVGAVGGFVVALASGGGVVGATAVYALAGGVFGVVTTRLARRGRILPGEPA